MSSDVFPIFVIYALHKLYVSARLCVQSASHVLRRVKLGCVSGFSHCAPTPISFSHIFSHEENKKTFKL